MVDVTSGSRAPVRLSEAAIQPLGSLDPAEPLDDLAWLDEAIGDARVVAIGDSAYYTGESVRLHHRLLRYLVERHGFDAFAMESGFVEGWSIDDWVRDGRDDLDEVLANGLTSLMGEWSQVRALVKWLRDHNRATSRPVGFYGVAMSGSAASLLPGLDAISAYLAEVDPGFEIAPNLRRSAESFARPSTFSMPQALVGYRSLPPAERDELTAGLADHAARMSDRRLDYIRGGTVAAYERAYRTLAMTIALDALIRRTADGDIHEAFMIRDAAAADTVEWLLRQGHRVVLASHNGHIQRGPCAAPGMAPATTLGLHLAYRLGADYLPIATTNGVGDTLNTNPDFYTGALFTKLEAPRPGSLDALMDASHDGPFAVDLRRLPPADHAAVRAVAEQRFNSCYQGIDPLAAYDVVVHLPHVTAADADPDTLAHAPHETREAFAHYTSDYRPAF